MAQAAGIELSHKDPVDGISFLPQLRGQTGTSRDWVLCHYQPYWNKTPGQFVRGGRYKLYRDGRLYDVPGDLEEAADLANTADKRIKTIRQKLNAVLDNCPPAPTDPKANKNTKSRPTYPDWKNLREKPAGN